MSLDDFDVGYRSDLLPNLENFFLDEAAYDTAFLESLFASEIVDVVAVNAEDSFLTFASVVDFD